MNGKRAFIHVVDDDVAFRRGLERLLKAVGYDVFGHESASHFLKSGLVQQRGCILLDVQMSGLSGTDLQDKLLNLNCKLPIIFLTGHGDFPTIVRTIKKGAEDFIAKPAPKTILLGAIERSLQRYDDECEQKARLDLCREHLNSLTPREREVFGLVVRGKLNKQIAYELDASERTVKAHRHNIVQKFEVKSLAELVSIAERLGVLREPEDWGSPGKLRTLSVARRNRPVKAAG
jgi:FixJ family two-component response regulator